MSASQTEIRDLTDQFVYDLAAVYDMELKLVDELAELSRLATNDNLDAGFAIHRKETKGQARRLEEVFEALGMEPTRRDNPIADGLLTDREQFDASVQTDDLRNLRYLNVGLMTERIEITTYEGLLLTGTEADLGDDVLDPLEANLEQERKTLRKLEGLAAGSAGESFWDGLVDLSARLFRV